MNVNIVINDFKDLKDNDHLYVKGDLFPFENKDIEQSRIDELSSKNNKINKKLIKKTTIDNLTEIQLLEYASILNLNIKDVLLNSIMQATKKNTTTNENNESSDLLNE